MSAKVRLYPCQFFGKNCQIELDGAIGRSMATMVMHPNGTIGAPYRRWSPLAPTLGYVAVMIYIYLYVSVCVCFAILLTPRHAL